MSKKTFLFSEIIFLIFFLYGCGVNEATIQRAPKSFLYFSGNIENSFVLIDNGNEIELGKTRIEPNDSKNMKTTKRVNKVYYELQPGKHVVVVKRDGIVVVHRVLILVDDVVKEVLVP